MVTSAKRSSNLRGRGGPPDSLAVIADDFTGACDAGVQFVKLGFRTCVSFSRQFSRNACDVFQVHVHDTETRNVSPKTAYRRVSMFCKNCQRAHAELIYKKVDSTLRGNLGAELDAILDTFKDRFIIIAPTYPEYKRTSVGGNLLVGGALLEETEFAREIFKPGQMRSSNIGAIINSQSNRTVVNIPLSVVRKGAAATAKSILQLSRNNVRIFHTDAVSRSDLKNVAKACLQINALPCGSAGLAEQIAVNLFPQGRRPVLVICGSTNEATMREVQRGRALAAVVTVRATNLMKKGRARKREITRIQCLTRNALESGRSVIVSSALSKLDVDRVMRIMSRRTRSQVEHRQAIVRGLAAATAPIVLYRTVGGVILTGGEMTAAFLQQIRAREVRLENEVVTGIALGTVVGGYAAGLRIVTKAGGFALPGSLARIMRYLGHRTTSKQSGFMTKDV